MDRRSFISGIGVSLGLASLPSFASAQWAYCGPATPTPETLPDYGWDFFDMGYSDAHGSIERYWMGTAEAAQNVVFGDE